MRVFSVNYVPTNHAFVFVRYQETITIRSFEPIPDAELPNYLRADAAQSNYAMLHHGRPFTPDGIRRDLAYSGECFIGSHSVDRLYKLVDSMCWSAASDFLGTSAVSDRSAWMFMARPDGTFIDPFNRTLETLPTRAHRNTVYTNKQANSIMTICQPYADSPLDDCTVFVKYSESIGYRHNLGSTIPRIQGTPSPDDVWPTLRLIGPETMAVDSMTDVAVEVLAPGTQTVDTRCNSTLYLEDIDGYAPSLRVKVQNGVGVFRASSDGLQPGERVRIKIGWRNWPGEIEYNPLVV
jgi:hypothetical protein